MSAATIQHRTVTIAEFGGASVEVDTTGLSDRDRILEAFRAWRKLTGGRARGSFACCGSCGHYELSSMDEGDRSYVFWNRQSDDSFDDAGDLTSTLWLQHSAQSDELELLVDLLRAVGLESRWNGSEGQCVAVEG